MKTDSRELDIAIIGGGLAGLSASILLSRAGFSVALIEKETYPFHKVCGEYISLESWNFLKDIGLPLDHMQLPRINSLLLTAPNGAAFSTALPLGGFGISRYLLDATLAGISKKQGTTFYEETRVDEVKFESGMHHLHVSGKEGPAVIKAKICLAAYGKRSNLDIKWKRNFLYKHNKRTGNYIGVKYHLNTNWYQGIIGLHNFKDGYCGISAIEENKYCLCYMTKADNLKACGNSLQKLQETILYKNPHLKKIFQESKIEKGFPITISQISFDKKLQVEDHILMLGDAAGMITPLCGNGMSMAMHSAKLSTCLVDQYLKKNISREQMENSYILLWNKHFAKRLRMGRTLQQFFGSNLLTDFFVAMLRIFPFLASPLVKRTHGEEF